MPRLATEVAAVLLVGLALFLFLSLVSFDVADLPGRVHPPNSTLANWCGEVGVWVAASLSDWLGILSGYLVIGVLGLVARGLFRREAPSGIQLCGALGILLAVSAFEHYTVEMGWIGYETFGARLPGGFWGTYLATESVGAFHGLGAAILLGTIFLISGLLFFDVEPTTLLDRVSVGGKETGGGTSSSTKSTKMEKGSREKMEEKKKKTSKKKPVLQIGGVATAEADPKKETEKKKASASTSRKSSSSSTSKKTSGKTTKKKKKKKKRKKKAGAARTARKSTIDGDWEFPPVDMLAEPEEVDNSKIELEMERRAEVLTETLSNFRIEAEVLAVDKGPNVTMFELKLAPGVKVSSIVQRQDDVAVALKAGNIRIVAPIPGKSTIGIEVPNQVQETVRLRELLSSDTYRKGEWQIPLFLGKSASGKPLLSDLAKMPHFLIAGATGSGKSVCINSLIMSVLMTRSADAVKLILIDPKMVELSLYEDVPHLISPVVTDMKRAQAVLDWAVQEMEDRYELLRRAGVRNIKSYNDLGEKGLKKRLDLDDEGLKLGKIPTHISYIVVVIDELADLMMVARKEVETSITRLAQKSRAVGIHCILATQRPSVDVITGLIKSNMPTRASFQVTSAVDSRTILDQNGGEKLVGMGDMLFMPPRSSSIIRAQGCFIADDEIRRVTGHIKKQKEPVFHEDLMGWEPGKSKGSDKDELYDDAVRIILGEQRGSASLLQRQLEIGYTRASRLIDMMEEEGLIGPHRGSKARDVLVKLEDWEAAQGK